MDRIIRWELVDPSRNRRRWYEIERDGLVVIRRWGRIGRKGYSKIDWCGTPQIADLLFRRIVRRRELHGYAQVPVTVQTTLWPEAA